MSPNQVPNPQSDADQLEAAADQAIAACGGDTREAVKALIVANHFQETELEKLRAAVSTGYARAGWSSMCPRPQGLVRPGNVTTDRNLGDLRLLCRFQLAESL